MTVTGIGNVGQQCGRVLLHRVVATAKHILDDEVRLGQVRRTRHVADDAARLTHVEGMVEQAGL